MKKLLIGLMAAAICLSAATGGTVRAEAKQNARVQDIEKTLMKQIGGMPKLNTGEKYGALVISLTNPFWVTMKDSYIAAANQYGVKIDVMAAPTEGDKQSQLETLNGMVLKNYKGIVLSPIEPFNLLPGIAEANKNKVPVVNLGPGINTEKLKEMGGHLDGRLTVNFERQGELVAKDIATKLKGKGKVAIIQGIPGAGQSEGRTAGAKKGFASGGLELVSVQPANWDSTAAYNAASDLIQAHPDLKAIFACNDVMALAVSKALIDAKAKSKILVYGIDGTEEAKKAILEKRMDGTVTYPQSVYAKAALLMMMTLSQGMKLPATVFCPLDIITSDNISQFNDYK